MSDPIKPVNGSDSDPDNPEQLELCPSLKDRFLSKVNRLGFRPCWIWQGAKNNRGYGRLGNKLAHRVAFELFRCEIPKGILVCHKCDEPLCVRPGHLFLGTQKDNMLDASKKGRLYNPMKAKTHCKKGHLLNNIDSNGDRRCGECHRKSGREHYYRNKERLNSERRQRRRATGK